MTKTNYKRNMGSVSHGTMREEDLIPSFLWKLQQMRPLKREHAKLVREIEARMADYAENDIAAESTYYQCDDATGDLESLFDALDFYALPGFYFGAHPGDGSDYGFWLSESFVGEFDGLRVSDTSEVPRGFSGEVLHVNDHGNLTLYAAARGRLREVWAIA